MPTACVDAYARALGLPFRFPAKFPIATQAAARMTVWARDTSPERAKALASAHHAHLEGGHA
ncbi:MAG: 2-hydroxychromene-2-carboxylate isomerase, partial [Steroidobacteraceae bacterium]